MLPLLVGYADAFIRAMRRDTDAGAVKDTSSEFLRISQALLRNATNYDNNAEETGSERPRPERSSFIGLIWRSF
jgi:hypothetical protein